jgi:succinate-semialdehyde dehydrogenase / glutarate-semialdehyde dehydrogenase
MGNFHKGVHPHMSHPILSTNPANGQLLKSFEPLTSAQIDEKIERADATYRQYRRTSFAQRAGWLLQAAAILDSEKESFGRLMTLEMGKPLKSAYAEVEKCARVCRYYAQFAEQFLSDQDIQTEASRSRICYQPIGPVLAVMPWNFPFWQVFRFAAPALMAGNVGLLKHASIVPQSALAIEEVFRRVGLPEGAFQTLLISAGQVNQVIEDKRIKAVTLTGSTEAGSQVASLAGRLIKKTVLELGGSDPFIVMPSANLDEAVTTAIKARMINNGQSCIAAKRFIIAEQIAPEFEKRFVEGMQALKVGDPLNLSTDLGPLATHDLLETLDRQVTESINVGAKALIGGKPLGGVGNFYPPTILVNIHKQSPAYTEEIFGPVALLYRVPDIDQAIALANDTPFGLGASAWTNDRQEKDRFITDLESGMVFINGLVASDPRLPFGGIKESGYGRELSELGIREFVNIKTVWEK